MCVPCVRAVTLKRKASKTALRLKNEVTPNLFLRLCTESGAVNAVF
jgi:hypothetical protein